MPEKEPVDHQAEWVKANMGESFTQAFDIRQVMYRIQDVDLPFKRGIRVEQFLMFFGAFLVTFVLNNVIVYPIMGLLGIKLPPTFHIALWLALPIFSAVRIGKPMPQNKTISGTAASFLRYYLDDRWHCRGLPMKEAPQSGLQGNYYRTWTVDPAYAGVESPGDIPATEFTLYTNLDLPDGRVMLPGEVVEKKRILEDEEEFLDRLTARDNIGSTEDVQETNSIVDLASQSGSYLISEDQAPAFDRSELRRRRESV